MIHKLRSSRRFVRARHISRKRRIEKEVLAYSPEELDKQPKGVLSKGKIHCSCDLCTCKSTIDTGVKTNSKRNYTAADTRRMNSTDYSLTEYNQAM
jgi:hypothetical protein